MAGTEIQVRGATELRATLERAADDLRAIDRDVPFPEVAARIRATAAPITIAAGGATIPVGAPIVFGFPPPQTFITEAVKRTEPATVDLYQHAVEKILGQVHGV